MGGGRVSDILSQGGDREPGPRRRWVAAIAVLALVTVLIVLHLPHHRPSVAQPRPAPAAPSSVPLGPGSPGPGGLSGLAMSRDSRLRLPVTGPRPAWLSPSTGREEPVGGLPRDSSGYQFTRVGRGWAVRANAGGRLRCGSCAGPLLPVYYLADGAKSVTRVGTADDVAPAASARALWLTSYPPGSNMSTTAGTAQQVSVAGIAAGRPLRLPARYVIDQGTDRGLLLAPMDQAGTAAYRLWDPAAPGAGRSFERVMAASPGQVAWATRCAPLCHVRVVDLATGRYTAIALPGASSAVNGVFSPDGKFLAVQVSLSGRGGGGALAMQLDVASITSHRPVVVPGIQVSSDALESFGWPAPGDDLVAELSFIAKVQVASWHPGARHLAVAVIQPGPGFGSLILR
jgi:hypothetical protein